MAKDDGHFIPKIWKNRSKIFLWCNKLAAGCKIGKKRYRAISGVLLYPWGIWTLIKYISESLVEII